MLEEMINASNQAYLAHGLACVQKIPTPITPCRMDGRGHITLAFFEKKSTVDYIGAVQGIPICFDAKESQQDTFPLKNIHLHQVRFMQDYAKQGGVAFIIIYYVHRDKFCFMPIEDIIRFMDRAGNGGRKSIAFNELDPRWLFDRKSSPPIPYLEQINDYLAIQAERIDDERS